MKKITLIILLQLACVFSAMASDTTRVVYGPWVTKVTETSFTVSWTTNENMLAAVEVNTPEGTKTFYQSPLGRRHNGTTHQIEVSGLTKGTCYTYTIEGEPCIDDSQPYKMKFEPRKCLGSGQATTLDYGKSTCKFVMVNDIHFKDAEYAALIGTPKRGDFNPDFIFTNGDIVSYCRTENSVLKHYVAPIQEALLTYPIFITRGNHETRGAGFEALAKFFPTPNGKFYYTFRQGPVGVIVLDCGEDKVDSHVEYSGTANFDNYRMQELEWLKTAIEDPVFASAPQKICVIHVPTRHEPNAWYSQSWISDNFIPLLNKAGVTLMLSGHHHKFILSEAGAYGNDYEILVNNKAERLEFEATATSINIRTYDIAGNLTHEFSK